MDRTIWMFFTLAVLSMLYVQLETSDNLREQTDLLKQISKLSEQRHLATFQTNYMCLSELVQVKRFLGRDHVFPSLEVPPPVIMATVTQPLPIGVGGGDE